jgi:hypothetical protein
MTTLAPPRKPAGDRQSIRRIPSAPRGSSKLDEWTSRRPADPTPVVSALGWHSVVRAFGRQVVGRASTRLPVSRASARQLVGSAHIERSRASADARSADRDENPQHRNYRTEWRIRRGAFIGRRNGFGPARRWRSKRCGACATPREIFDLHPSGAGMLRMAGVRFAALGDPLRSKLDVQPLRRVEACAASRSVSIQELEVPRGAREE